VLGSAEEYWAVLGSLGQCWEVLGSAWQCWAVLGYAVLYWNRLEWYFAHARELINAHMFWLPSNEPYCDF